MRTNAERLLEQLQRSAMDFGNGSARTASAHKQAVSVETVTPAMAVQLLNANQGNRPIRDARVETLVRAINEGRWKLTNDAVMMTGHSYAQPGRIINGQHRLFACAEAGVPIEVLVLFGADESSFPVIDTGSRRRAADVLPGPGARQKAAAAHLVLWYERGRLSVNGSTAYAANDEIVGAYRDHPTIGVAYEEWHGKFSKLASSRAGGIAFAAMAMTIDPVAANEFMEALCSGEGLLAGNPILTLRTKYIADAVKRGGGARTAFAPRHLAAHIKCWTAWRAKQPLARIQFRDGEGFPILPGYARNPGTW